MPDTDTCTSSPAPHNGLADPDRKVTETDARPLETAVASSGCAESASANAVAVEVGPELATGSEAIPAMLTVKLVADKHVKAYSSGLSGTSSETMRITCSSTAPASRT